MPQITITSTETVEGAKGEYLKATTSDGKYFNIFGDLMENVKGPGVYDVAFTKKGKYTNISEIAKSKNQAPVSNGSSAAKGYQDNNTAMFVSSCVNAAAEITKAVIDKGMVKDEKTVMAMAGGTLLHLLLNIKTFLHGGVTLGENGKSDKPVSKKKAPAPEETEEPENEELEESVPF